MNWTWKDDIIIILYLYYYSSDVQGKGGGGSSTQAYVWGIDLVGYGLPSHIFRAELCYRFIDLQWLCAGELSDTVAIFSKHFPEKNNSPNVIWGVASDITV